VKERFENNQIHISTLRKICDGLDDKFMYKDGWDVELKRVSGEIQQACYSIEDLARN
jgi:hypothetical protein